jgi:hypothetical protein
MNAIVKPAPADVPIAARDYANRGYSVVLLYGVDASGRCGCGAAGCDAPGAHPIGGLPRWVRGRASAAQLRHLFSEHPGANVGILTGAASGVVAVEVRGKEGHDAFRKIDAGERTPIVYTGEPTDLVLLYRHPEGAPLGRYRGDHAGVRVLADGQYVVMPPSHRADGARYGCPDGFGLDVPLAPLPSAILVGFERPAPTPTEAPEPGRTPTDAEQLAEMLDLPAPASPDLPALELARRGFHVFPIHANTKNRPIDSWPERATTDAATVTAWWRDPVTGWAQPENIGIAAGTRLRDGGFLLVIDVDDKPGKTGSASLAALEAQHGALPRTLTARTASGGRHLYFRTPYPTSPTVERLGPGVDTRGFRSYVVAPGSTIDGRAYEWLDDAPIEDLPESFLGLLERARERERSKTTIAAGVELDTGTADDRAMRYLLDAAPPAIEGAHGNDTTYKVACRVRDFGLSESAINTAMLEHYNPRCSPPWEPDDLARIVASACKNGQNPAGKNDPRADFGPVPVDPAPAAPTDAAPAQPTTDAAPAPAAAAAPAQPTTDAAPAPAPRFKITMLADVRLDDGVPWLVDKLLPAGGLGVIYAAPNVGKSFFAMNLALAVARGTPFYGRPVQQGGALYIAAEDAPGVAVRARATKTLAKLPDDVPFAILPESVSFAQAKRDLPELFKAIDAAADRTGPLRLIVIDTLARAMAGLDENTAADMGTVVAACAAIQKRTGAHVLLVHHAGKDAAKGSRGSSVLLAAADTEIKASVNSRGTRVAEVTKQRNASTGDRFRFTIRKFSLPGDDGKAVETAVMVELAGTDPAADFAPAEVQPLRHGSAPEKALEILAELLEEQPVSASGDGMPEVVIPEFDWKDAFRAAGIASEKSVHQAFEAARKRLLKGYISKLGESFALTPAGRRWIEGKLGEN